MISLYCWDSEGLSKRNLDLLHYAAMIISSLHGPWVLSADFNMSPETLRASGWINLVKGKIVEPDAPTCGLQKYDFFVVSNSLGASVVGAAVVSDAGLHPHSPVRLFLRGSPRSISVRELAQPRKFEAMLPSSCLRDHSRFDTPPLHKWARRLGPQ